MVKMLILMFVSLLFTVDFGTAFAASYKASYSWFSDLSWCFSLASANNTLTLCTKCQKEYQAFFNTQKSSSFFTDKMWKTFSTMTHIIFTSAHFFILYYTEDDDEFVWAKPNWFFGLRATQQNKRVCRSAK